MRPDIKKEDMEELERFIHAHVINSLRLLANNGERIVSRRKLWKWGIDGRIENEMIDLGLMEIHDEFNLLVNLNDIPGYLKEQTALSRQQTRLEVA